MDNASLWHRLQQWKRPRRLAVPIGELLRPATRGLAHAEHLRSVRAIVDEVVDPALRSHIAAVGLEGVRLTVAVDHAAVAYALRREYLFRIRDHVARACPQLNITDIRFEVAKRNTQR